MTKSARAQNRFVLQTGLYRVESVVRSNSVAVTNVMVPDFLYSYVRGCIFSKACSKGAPSRDWMGGSVCLAALS